MKVAIVLLALTAVAAANSYGRQHVDYSHVPYYSVDWVVKDDYYNDFGQKEIREHDNTKTNWGVALPGKSHIKRDDIINAQMHVSHSVGHYDGDYKKTEYKADNYKKVEYKADGYKQTY